MSSTMSTTLETNAGPDTHVQGDLRCAECGYNLRTLAYTAGCPECGMSVLVSARGDRLAAAPAAWLERLSRGAWWLRLSVLIACPVVYLGAAVSGYAIWRLTAAQPGRTEPSMDRGYRQAARWATAIGGLALTAMTLGALAYIALTEQRFAGEWGMKIGSGIIGRSVPGGRLPVFDAAFLAAHAVYVLGLLSTWRHLGLLAERVPDREVAAAWRALARSWVGAVVVVVGVCVGSYLLVSGGFTSFLVPVGLVLFFACVLLKLWGVTFRAAGRQLVMLERVCRTHGDSNPKAGATSW
jgi:hypothetical protein